MDLVSSSYFVEDIVNSYDSLLKKLPNVASKISTIQSETDSAAKELEERLRTLIEGYEHLNNFTAQIPEHFHSTAQEHKRNLLEAINFLDTNTNKEIEPQLQLQIDQMQRELQSMNLERIVLAVTTKQLISDALANKNKGQNNNIKSRYLQKSSTFQGNKQTSTSKYPLPKELQYPKNNTELNTPIHIPEFTSSTSTSDNRIPTSKKTSPTKTKGKIQASASPPSISNTMFYNSLKKDIMYSTVRTGAKVPQSITDFHLYNISQNKKNNKKRSGGMDTESFNSNNNRSRQDHKEINEIKNQLHTIDKKYEVDVEDSKIRLKILEDQLQHKATTSPSQVTSTTDLPPQPLSTKYKILSARPQHYISGNNSRDNLSDNNNNSNSDSNYGGPAATERKHTKRIYYHHEVQNENNNISNIYHKNTISDSNSNNIATSNASYHSTANRNASTVTPSNNSLHGPVNYTITNNNSTTGELQWENKNKNNPFDITDIINTAATTMDTTNYDIKDIINRTNNNNNNNTGNTIEYYNNNDNNIKINHRSDDYTSSNRASNIYTYSPAVCNNGHTSSSNNIDTTTTATSPNNNSNTNTNNSNNKNNATAAATTTQDTSPVFAHVELEDTSNRTSRWISKVQPAKFLTTNINTTSSNDNDNNAEEQLTTIDADEPEENIATNAPTSTTTSGGGIEQELVKLMHTMLLSQQSAQQASHELLLETLRNIPRYQNTNIINNSDSDSNGSHNDFESVEKIHNEKDTLQLEEPEKEGSTDVTLPQMTTPDLSKISPEDKGSVESEEDTHSSVENVVSAMDAILNPVIPTSDLGAVTSFGQLLRSGCLFSNNNNDKKNSNSTTTATSNINNNTTNNNDNEGVLEENNIQEMLFKATSNDVISKDTYLQLQQNRLQKTAPLPPPPPSNNNNNDMATILTTVITNLINHQNRTTSTTSPTTTYLPLPPQPSPSPEQINLQIEASIQRGIRSGISQALSALSSPSFPPTTTTTTTTNHSDLQPPSHKTHSKHHHTNNTHPNKLTSSSTTSSYSSDDKYTESRKTRNAKEKHVTQKSRVTSDGLLRVNNSSSTATANSNNKTSNAAIHPHWQPPLDALLPWIEQDIVTSQKQLQQLQNKDSNLLATSNDSLTSAEDEYVILKKSNNYTGNPITSSSSPRATATSTRSDRGSGRENQVTVHGSHHLWKNNAKTEQWVDYEDRRPPSKATRTSTENTRNYNRPKSANSRMTQKEALSEGGRARPAHFPRPLISKLLHSSATEDVINMSLDKSSSLESNDEYANISSNRLYSYKRNKNEEIEPVVTVNGIPLPLTMAMDGDGDDDGALSVESSMDNDSSKREQDLEQKERQFQEERALILYTKQLERNQRKHVNDTTTSRKGHFIVDKRTSQLQNSTDTNTSDSEESSVVIENNAHYSKNTSADSSYSSSDSPSRSLGKKAEKYSNLDARLSSKPTCIHQTYQSKTRYSSESSGSYSDRIEISTSRNSARNRKTDMELSTTASTCTYSSNDESEMFGKLSLGSVSESVNDSETSNQNLSSLLNLINTRVDSKNNLYSNIPGSIRLLRPSKK